MLSLITSFSNKNDNLIFPYPKTINFKNNNKQIFRLCQIFFKISLIIFMSIQLTQFYWSPIDR
jgi:hypothetical protein